MQIIIIMIVVIETILKFETSNGNMMHIQTDDNEQFNVILVKWPSCARFNILFDTYHLNLYIFCVEYLFDTRARNIIFEGDINFKRATEIYVSETKSTYHAT